MKVYTKEGDLGTSSVLGSKKRISKSSLIFDLLGLCDEINATLGCALSDLKTGSETLLIGSIQEELFQIGAFIAGLKPTSQEKKVWAAKVRQMESKMDEYSLKLPVIKSFVLPGGTKSASQIHLARVKVRTLERGLVSYINRGSNSALKFLLPYVNRLSDLLFIMARYANKIGGKEERLWRHKK